jgi:hypothetical protein
VAVIQALTAIWTAAGSPWSVRLKALLPLWLPWARRRLRLSATVCQQLRAISPRQIDRRLAATKHHIPLEQRPRLGPAIAARGELPLGLHPRRVNIGHVERMGELPIGAMAGMGHEV